MAWRSISTAGDASSTSLAIATPTGAVTDDILVMHFYGETTLGLTLSFDKGTWTKITAASGQQLGESVDFEVYRYWARMGSISGNITITWGGATLWNAAICTCQSGRFASGDPQDATATFNIAGAAGTTATALGLTTGNTNADLLMFESDAFGSTHTAWTAGLTERADFGGQGFAEGTQAGAGASGNKTVDVSSSCWWTGALIVLREAGAGAVVSKRSQSRPFPFKPGSPRSSNPPYR